MPDFYEILRGYASLVAFLKARKIITTVIKKGLNGDIFTKKTCLRSEILIIIVKYNIGFQCFCEQIFCGIIF
jgi:hypothetical protein